MKPSAATAFILIGSSLRVDRHEYLNPYNPAHHSLYGIAVSAIRQLPLQGRELHIVPQNLIEFWAVITRPIAYNGLGLTTVAAIRELERLKTMFILPPDSAAIYPAWEALVRRYQVSGKPTMTPGSATMQVHGLTSILTFNPSDFRRYAGMKVVEPADVVKSASE